MRTISSAMLLVAGLVLSGPLFADEATGLYFGGGAGQSEVKDLCEGATTCDDTDTAMKLFAGYSFNRFLAVEGGYVDFGEGSASGVALGVPFSATAEAWGITAHAVGSIPIWKGLSLIGRVGAVFWNVDVSATVDGVPLEADDDGVSLAAGAGVQWMFGRNFGVRAEYEFFDAVGESDLTEESDIQVISVSALFKF